MRLLERADTPLQGADAVVFVADSQIAETEANKVSFRNLRANLSANGLPPDLPLVLQFNKRDLPNVRTEAELEQLERVRATPIYRSVAIRGEGVRETLDGLLRLTWQRLQLADKLRVDADSFLDQMFARWRRPRPLTGPLP